MPQAVLAQAKQARQVLLGSVQQARLHSRWDAYLGAANVCISSCVRPPCLEMAAHASPTDPLTWHVAAPQLLVACQSSQLACSSWVLPSCACGSP